MELEETSNQWKQRPHLITILQPSACLSTRFLRLLLPSPPRRTCVSVSACACACVCVCVHARPPPAIPEDGAIPLDGREPVERDDFVERFINGDLAERPGTHARKHSISWQQAWEAKDKLLTE